MNFVEKIIQSIQNFMSFIGDALLGIVQFLAKPLVFLLEFFEAIFYFVVRFFEIAIAIVSLFVALFQYFFSLVGGLFKGLRSFVGFSPAGSYTVPSASKIGFESALEQIGLTGFLTTIPNILIAIVWLIFALKMIQLYGGKGDIAKR